MSVSYFRMKPTGQKHAVIDRPTAGINMYDRAFGISDTNFSEALDASPEKNDIVKLHSFSSSADAGVYYGNPNCNGWVRSVVSFRPYSSFDALAMVSYDSALSKYFLVMAAVEPAEAFTPVTIFDVNALTGWGADTYKNYVFSSTVFAVEAKVYAVFSMFTSNKILWFDGTEYGVITVPFTPRRIASHVNRIFAIDTKNKLWWCRAGDMWTWYGLEQDDDYLKASGSMANGAYALTAQPDVPRPISFTITTVVTPDTLGYIDIVGTNKGVAVSERLYLNTGLNVSTKSYEVITSITQAGWSASGTADTIKIGIAPIGTGFVQEDQGYWTLERESILCDLCVLSNELYIFSNSSIYAFSGYSPDTFTMREVITDLGISTGDSTIFKQLCVSNNMAYFLSNDNVYEFNGGSTPRLISHPIKTNGSVANFLYSGVPEIDCSRFEIVADDDRLIVYLPTVGTTRSVAYMFMIKARSWWKMSAFDASDTQLGANGRFEYVKNINGSGIFAVTSNLVTNTFDLFTDRLGTLYSDYWPYIVTKAFGGSPTEDEAMTGLVISCQGNASSIATFSVYISELENGDSDWTLLKQEDIVFTGSIDYMTINMYPPLLKRRKLYRLKIKVVLPNESVGLEYVPVYIYNIERIYRTIGRTR